MRQSCSAWEHYHYILLLTSQCVIHVESEKLRLFQVKTSVDEDSK